MSYNDDDDTRHTVCDLIIILVCWPSTGERARLPYRNTNRVIIGLLRFKVNLFLAFRMELVWRYGRGQQ